EINHRVDWHFGILRPHLLREGARLHIEALDPFVPKGSRLALLKLLLVNDWTLWSIHDWIHASLLVNPSSLRQISPVYERRIPILFGLDLLLNTSLCRHERSRHAHRSLLDCLLIRHASVNRLLERFVPCGLVRLLRQ